MVGRESCARTPARKTASGAATALSLRTGRLGGEEEKRPPCEVEEMGEDGEEEAEERQRDEEMGGERDVEEGELEEEERQQQGDAEEEFEDLEPVHVDLWVRGGEGRDSSRKSSSWRAGRGRR